MRTVSDILEKKELSRDDIVFLLSLTDSKEQRLLLKKAYSEKEKFVGKKAYLRGLVELSNICKKNCLYCGIRAGNKKVNRYMLSGEEVIETVKSAQKNRFSSIVIQSGEQNRLEFTEEICNLISEIKKIRNPEFRFTLSLGEQSLETYTKWFNAGAQRYLLRIETSNEELYRKIHPDNKLHSFKTRLQCLKHIKRTGYQTGTGVMIGLPFQTIENLADDLLFIKNMDIDMVGMGPYLEHTNTPLFKHKDNLLPLTERFNLSLRMVAVLRILMPYINIASTTALQSVVSMGRERGLKAGANVLIPNLTHRKYRSSYLLYENKPCIDEEADECIGCLAERVSMVGEEIDYDYGDSKHFINKRRTLTD